jgi:predicted dehydrogenase
MGMVGGGPDAFIGEIHRKAARMDGGIDIVAGAFSRSPQKSKKMAKALNIDPKRAYKNYKEMARKEALLPDGQKIDFVSIVTTNDTHFDIAATFLKAGFHVVCEKPMTHNSRQARQLTELVKKSGKLFALTHNYTGYPMVKLARDMIKDGDIGKIRKVIVQYPQGWLSKRIEKEGAKQAQWRTDPKRSGAAGCMGDIGTHAENLAEYITGLKITEICADLTTFAKGRKLDDDGNCLLRFNNGAKGILHASQISIGQENNLAIWVFGQDRSLEWHQEHPNYLYLYESDAPVQIWRRGNDYVAAKSPAAGRATRLPFGHPEAFIEAFANVYCNFADTLRAKLTRNKPDPLAKDYPDVKDGLRGMLFIDTVLASAKSNKKWIKFKK